VQSQQLIKISLFSTMMAGNNYTITFPDFSGSIRAEFAGIYKGSYLRNGQTVYVHYTSLGNVLTDKF
jgi:hypothetical protein